MRYRKLSENYVNYINSDEWKMKRQHILYIRHNTCEKCGNRVDYRFHVHHLTYKNLGHEKDEDLMLLCEHCHSNIHGRDLTLGQNYTPIWVEKDHENKPMSKKFYYIRKNMLKKQRKLKRLRKLKKRKENQNAN